MATHISAFSESHIDTAAALYAAAYNGQPWNEAWTPALAKARLQEIYDTPRFLGFVTLDESATAVALAIGSRESWHDGPHFQVKEVCVHPESQGRGLGRAVLRTDR